METTAAPVWKLVVPPLQEVMREAGLEEAYVLRRQNTVTQYIAK